MYILFLHTCVDTGSHILELFLNKKINFTELLDLLKLCKLNSDENFYQSIHL